MEITTNSLFVTKMFKNKVEGYNLFDKHMGIYRKEIIGDSVEYKLHKGVYIDNLDVIFVNTDGYILRYTVDEEDWVTGITCINGDFQCRICWNNNTIYVTKAGVEVCTYSKDYVFIEKQTHIYAKDFNKWHSINDIQRLPINCAGIAPFNSIIADEYFIKTYDNLLTLINKNKAEGYAKCVACHAMPAIYIVKNCMHLVYCDDCNEKANDNCPLCRNDGERVKVYY